jgi:hypothetical protein
MEAIDTAQAIVNGKYLLEKHPGKGGWTYAVIPEVAPNKKAWFGWVKIKGFIDEYEIKQMRLMPMGQGRLFLPVKAEIRKKIGKNAGDWVHLILYRDDMAMQVPDELILCLEEEPRAYEVFLGFTESEKKYYIDWIYSAKKDETKIERIVKTIDRLLLKKKFYEK